VAVSYFPCGIIDGGTIAFWIIDMSDESPLEKRLAALEASMADLQRRLAGLEQPKRWLDKIVGSFRDEPEFGKVLEYGREFRYSDRPPQDSGA
jgi:hypothetical protein